MVDKKLTGKVEPLEAKVAKFEKNGCSILKDGQIITTDGTGHLIVQEKK